MAIVTAPTPPPPTPQPFRLRGRDTAARPAEPDEAEQLDEQVPLRPAAETPNYTDVGNAQRLVDAAGDRFRYVGAEGTWRHYDQRRWVVDDRGKIVEAAKAMVEALMREALELPVDQRKHAIKWAQQSENAARIDAMIRLARSDPRVAIAPDDLDRHHWILNVANGAVDLRIGRLVDHNPKHLITRIAGTSFDPSARAPRWRHLLEEVLPDPDVRTFLQRAVGYSLTGDVSEQKMLIAHGGGANGKTVVLDTVRRMMGDYADQADPDLLLAKRDAHPTGLAKLRGKRFVLTSESDDGRRLAEATVKRLTGGDRVTARFMRMDFFEFDPTHKLWLVTNHAPRVRGTDHGLWRRLRIVPFEVTIPEERQDKHLARALDDELPGVLAWAVQGCLDWQQHGLTEPAAVTLATEAYRANNDVVGEFIGDSCTTEPTSMTSAQALYDAWKAWCGANGEDPGSQKALGQRLTERGFDRVKRGPHRHWHWLGLGVLAPSEANP